MIIMFNNHLQKMIQTTKVQNGKNRLVIKIIYDLNDNPNLLNQQLTKIIHLKITLRINGQKVNNINSQYIEDKNSALVPYVIDLN